MSQFEKTEVFYSKLSHELRTSKWSFGFFGCFNGKVHFKPRKIYEYLSYIKTSGKSLLNLVNSIHDFTKIDLEKIKLKNETAPKKILKVLGTAKIIAI